jgi:hypothetical protein
MNTIRTVWKFYFEVGFEACWLVCFEGKCKDVLVMLSIV